MDAQLDRVEQAVRVQCTPPTAKRAISFHSSNEENLRASSNSKPVPIISERPIWQRQYFPVCTVESLLASGPHRTSRTSIIAGKWFKELAAGWLRVLDSIRVQARDLVNVHRAVLCSNSASLQLCRTGICRPALLLSVIPLLCIM